jgi:predicted DNA-binding transcriptional regulator YafY
MTHPATRILAALELLQAHGRISGPDLAKRLGVHPRTVRRYIDTLEEIGIPITTERGRHGAYSLVNGFKLPPLMFTEDETLAVSLGLVAARSMGITDLAPAAETAQAKLERVMPEPLKRRVRAGSQRIAVDVGNGASSPANDAALSRLIPATLERQRVHVCYRTAEGAISERDFDPYGIVLRDRRWYVVGYCHLRGDLRSLRVDRMQQLTLMPAGFDAPERFDAAAFLGQSIASMPRGAIATEVVLHTSMQRALMLFRDDRCLLEPDADGVRLRAHTDCLDWFAAELARLSCDFRVVAPDELRAAVRRSATRMLRAATAPADDATPRRAKSGRKTARIQPIR